MGEQMMYFLILIVTVTVALWAIDQRYRTQMYLDNVLREQKEETVEESLNVIRRMQYGNPHERALDKYRSRGSARSAEDLEVISSELGSMVDLADESASLAATYDAQRQLVGSQSDERENLNNRMEFLGNWIEDSAKHQVRHDAEIGSRTDEITVEVNRLHAQVQSLGKMAEEIKEVI